MSFANVIPTALLNHLWQSTLFAVAAALLAFLLRKNRAQTRYSLWLIASLKFLIPFSLFVAIGNHLQWLASAPAAHATLSIAVQEIGKPFFAPPLSFSVAQPAMPNTTDLVSFIVFAIWFCGFVAVLLRWLRSWIQIRAAVRAAEPLSTQAPIKILSSPTLLEPGVFGIFRPVLLLPEGITRHLTPAHLEAILAHELCHVRRRDNLAAALHMIVEAVFWFHPLVWWIGARMVEERERACDEEVIQLGNQPDVYAESILKTCQFYFEAPLACVAGISGSDLKKRILHIMTQGIAARLSLGKKLLLASAGITALTLPLAVGLTNASQAGNTVAPSFEVASIKPSKSGTPGLFRVSLEPGGRFVANGITVNALLQIAYGVKEAQISGGQNWINSDRFDIEAKPDDAFAAEMQKLTPDQRNEKVMLMLQSMLADRFKLTLSHETRDLPVYVLTVAKNGPKFHESAAPNPQASPTLQRRGIMMNSRGQLTVNDAGLDRFANVLSHQLGRVVLDKTGLTGKYDFTLNWTPDENEVPRMPGGPPPGADSAPPPESSGPPLFTAIQEQLGLKLEPQKAPVDVLVIEHVEKPSEN